MSVAQRAAPALGKESLSLKAINRSGAPLAGPEAEAAIEALRSLFVDAHNIP
jgi:hypothetical protein